MKILFSTIAFILFINSMASSTYAQSINDLWSDQGSCWTAYYSDTSQSKKEKIGYICFNNASVKSNCVDGVFDDGEMHAKLWETTCCYYPANKTYTIPHFVVYEKLTYMFELKFSDNKKQRLIGTFYKTPIGALPQIYNCVLTRGWEH